MTVCVFLSTLTSVREMTDCEVVKVAWGETGAHVRTCKKTGKKIKMSASRIVYFKMNEHVYKGHCYDVKKIVENDGSSKSFRCKVQCAQAKKCIDQVTCKVRFHAVIYASELSSDVLDVTNWEITVFPKTDHVRM